MFTPMCQIRSDSIVIFNRVEGVGNKENLKNKYSGQVKKGTRVRMARAIDIFVQRNPVRYELNIYSKKKFRFEGAFITLTISSSTIIEHKKAYTQLKKMLRILRERYAVTDYVWKAELQTRGQVHYHILTNQYIEYHKLRTEWNKIQRKAGWLKEYAKEHKHYNAPSVDVKSIASKKVKNRKAYLLKYVTKKGGGEIHGKVWDCSEELNKKYYTFHLDSEQVLYLVGLITRTKHKELEYAMILSIPDPKSIFNETNQQEYELLIMS